MLADMGLTVARQIPIDTIGGLISGAYSLHGGVIRGAGGRIVSHMVTSGAPTALSTLVPGTQLIGEMLRQGQLWQLTRDVAQVHSAVQTVLAVSMAGVALSGLGLVTSIAGFAYLSRRFAQVDAKLAELARDVKDIKDWLNSLQKSKLQFAIENVRHAESARDDALRRDMLLQSKREFSTLTHHYKEQWSRCRTVPEIDTVNDLYTLAMLGYAMVCSNLGLGEEAANDLKVHCLDWNAQARQHTRALLFNDRPARLLDAEYVEKLPARTLVGLMDFAHDTKRGIDWLDDLRIARAKDASLFDNIASSAPARLQRAMGKGTSTEFVATAESLRARAQALETNVAHYDFLNEKSISATAFQRALETARQQAGTEAIFVSAST